LRFAYSTINWGETPDLPAAFTQIGGAGWSAVELFGHALDWLGPPRVLRDRLAGLRVATLFGAVALPTDSVQVTTLRHRIDYAAEIGAEAFGLVGGNRLRWRPPSTEEYAELARFCEELAIYGAEQGVAVSYHPHVACTIETADEIDRLLDHTRHLRLCLDVSHIALVGEDPLEHLHAYYDRTAYIHLKDWARGKFVELGQGSLGIDFAALLRELADREFPGWIVVEQSRSDVSPVQSTTINAQFLTNLGYDLGLATAEINDRERS
jgi:sugar phosphate isomerase/epimerase